MEEKREPLKRWEDLTDEEKASGQWVQGSVDKSGRFVPHISAFYSEKKTARLQKQADYMKRVREKQARGENR